MTDTTTATPLDPYLQDGERLRHLLTNTQAGVERGADGGRAVRPDDGAGAYLGLTDHRIVILVADPVGRDTDFVTSHRYTNVAEVAVHREAGTPRVEFETQHGQAYSFPTRESDLEAVAAFLPVACDNPGAVSTGDTDLADHCEALSAHLAAGEWEAFDRRLGAAMEAVETRPETTASAQSTVERDLHCLVRDRYVLAGRETLTSARRRLDTGDLELSYRRARAAYDRFEQALERAQRDGLATENSMVGLTMADDIADTSLGRLFATGRHRSARAADRENPEERIADLEAALDIYETVGALVTGDATLSDDIRERAREEAAAAIEALVDVRLERAADGREAANWELAVGNEAAARELAVSARADLDRALELATAYPPGDADAIRTQRSVLRRSSGCARSERDLRSGPGPESSYSSSGSPVIASGRSTSMSESMVGARSASVPPSRAVSPPSLTASPFASSGSVPDPAPGAT